MSHYGAGHVSSDFVGLARKQRQSEEPACTHIYFTGCAGNIAAGKYNDGSHAMRPVLTRRVYDGRSGQLRGYFVPEVAMVLEYLSADGTLGLGRVGDNRSPRDGESVLVTIPAAPSPSRPSRAGIRIPWTRT